MLAHSLHYAVSCEAHILEGVLLVPLVLMGAGCCGCRPLDACTAVMPPQGFKCPVSGLLLLRDFHAMRIHDVLN